MGERQRTPVPPRFVFRDCAQQERSFRDAVLEGLMQEEKAIPCQFLYDRAGSDLFEAICDVPEYYLTRTEMQILSSHAPDIASIVGPGATVIELGSGSSKKIRILLDALSSPEVYVPVDVSREHLYGAALDIAKDYPALKVVAICADYASDFVLPDTGAPRVCFFPGSTIGNLTRDCAVSLLAHWRERLGRDGFFIVGADLKKDRARLEAAYNDETGLSERFIKNILLRMNRELDGGFDPALFAYEAHYETQNGRIAMHLRSTADQTVPIAGETIRFASGERIHVEYSHKYSIAEFQTLAADAGFRPVACYSDLEQLFSVHLLQCA